MKEREREEEEILSSFHFAGVENLPLPLLLQKNVPPPPAAAAVAVVAMCVIRTDFGAPQLNANHFSKRGWVFFFLR